VRVRLTLWHLTALVIVLVLYAGGVFAFVRHGLLADLDRQLREDFDRAEESFTRNADGTVSSIVADRDEEGTDPGGTADREATAGPFACVWSLDGRPLYRDPLAPPPVAAFGRGAGTAEAVFQSVQAPGGSWLRELTGRQDVAGGTAVLRVARSEDHLRHQLRNLLVILAAALPLACAFAGIGAYAVARRALAPVDRMATAAEHITAARLRDRLPIDNPDDELGHLASVFNAAFGRLETSFEQLRRFTADASHEMRTPLTAIRTVGEVGLRESRTDHAYRQIIGSMLEEADRLNRLVESLLTLARAEGGTARLAVERVDLCALAREVGEHLSVLAEDKRQAVTIDAPLPVVVLADRFVLRQAVINLLDNAIKYSPEDGPIRIEVTGQADATLAVQDSGPGIAPEHVDKIFDRFYRIEKSRSRDVGGAGLGLSIARWAVEAHGGRIDVEPAQPHGSIFRIVLPVPAGVD
jgi:heavy metal sensor kinase